MSMIINNDGGYRTIPSATNGRARKFPSNVRLRGGEDGVPAAAAAAHYHSALEIKPNSGEYGLPVGYLNHVITLLKLMLVSWNVNDKYKSNILMSLRIVNNFNKPSMRFIVTFTVLDVL